MVARRFVPFPAYWHDAPLDLSFLYEDEKPAGKRGFLRVKGDKFVFEDGTEARFWGTNFNSGLNFPPKEFSEKLARRLAKIGINLVRFHQMDAEWSTPNIFQISKGKRKGHTRELDPESLDRLDYLIYCLKREGIYIYMDMLTYRKFKTGDGVEHALQLADAARPYSNYDETLIRLQKEFNEQLWTHVNPYTGLAYKDEPAIVLAEVANESDMFHRKVEIPYYREMLEKKFRKFLQERGLEAELSEGPVDFSRRDPVMLEFLCRVQEEYYREIIGHLRQIGVKIPITGTNWSVNGANRRAQLVTDFDDSHSYFYGWKWREDERAFDNTPMVAVPDAMLPALAFCKQSDRPFFVSEWDVPWPNEWRADSPLFLAAAGLLQGWNGFAIHTYGYSTKTDVHLLGKESASRAIGGVPYREGVFTTWNDPAKFGLFYHAALLFRRGDVKPAQQSVAVRIDDASLPTVDSVPALSVVAEKHRVVTELAGRASGADRVVPADEPVVDAASGEVLSDTGEMYRSWKKRFGWIDTERTKAVYGFLAEAGEVELNGFGARVRNDYAVVAVSSLTDEPIGRSDNMLLTTVGRAENTGMTFNEKRNEVIDLGQPPIVIEAIEADIRIATDNPNLRVWSINADGFYAGPVPSEYKDGELRFRVGEQFPSMYYLIQAE